MKGRLKKKRSVKLRADSLKRENWKTFSQTSRKKDPNQSNHNKLQLTPQKYIGS